MNIIVRRIAFIGILLLVILACNLPSSSPVPEPNAANTFAAQTIAAIVSKAISSTPALVSPFPSATSVPSFTPSFTPLPTLTPTALRTSTPTVPMISVSVDTNCRVGPGKAYERVGGLLVGETAEVVARSTNGEYWYIRNPNDPNGFCWLWGEYATVSGNITNLPVYTPPPTATQAPSFELSYKGMDSCVGWWIELKLKNTSSLAFKSYTLSVKDAATSVLLTDFGNGFTNLDGCLASNTIPILTPDDSYTISTPAFAYDPNNHRIRASVTLCTGLNQGGQCVTETIEFKP